MATTLRWTEEEFEGLPRLVGWSEFVRVGVIWHHAPDDPWQWMLTGVAWGPLEVPAGLGPTVKEAKEKLQETWYEWCLKAGLV